MPEGPAQRHGRPVWLAAPAAEGRAWGRVAPRLGVSRGQRAPPSTQVLWQHLLSRHLHHADGQTLLGPVPSWWVCPRAGFNPRWHPQAALSGDGFG